MKESPYQEKYKNTGGLSVQLLMIADSKLMLSNKGFNGEHLPI